MASKHPHPNYQRSTTNPTVDVVCTVADLENVSISDLPRLSDVINPDALNKFIASTDSGKVMFEYAGYQIMIMADGSVTVDPVIEQTKH